MTISYDSHRAWLIRQVAGARAELHGYEQAVLGPLIRWSRDTEEQARFERGFIDGKAKILQDRLTTEREKE